MMSRRSMIGVAFVAAGFLAACGDSTGPTNAPRTSAIASFARVADSTQVSGGGGGGGGAGGGGVNAGGGGGGGAAKLTCGTLTNMVSYPITVYTTRTGIGFVGNATNCSGVREAFEVEVLDQDPNPACTIAFPHFIAAKNTDPAATTVFSVNSTLVPCQGVMHNVVINLYDSKTATLLATTTASAFL